MSVQVLSSASRVESLEKMQPNSFRRALLLRRGKKNERDGGGRKTVEDAQGVDPCQKTGGSEAKLVSRVCLTSPDRSFIIEVVASDARQNSLAKLLLTHTSAMASVASKAGKAVGQVAKSAPRAAPRDKTLSKGAKRDPELYVRPRTSYDSTADT